ncbi:unnamed protein product [marine sediment metagenome]|uniref:Uncharacterized protein n=1 Tax=marine sediment metagenome TaxID=412755 RepID=X0ZZU7_9ZZZZ
MDIYLPDARYADDEIARKYSSAPGYFDNNEESIKGDAPTSRGSVIE